MRKSSVASIFQGLSLLNFGGVNWLIGGLGPGGLGFLGHQESKPPTQGVCVPEKYVPHMTGSIYLNIR